MYHTRQHIDQTVFNNYLYTYQCRIKLIFCDNILLCWPYKMNDSDYCNIYMVGPRNCGGGNPKISAWGGYNVNSFTRDRLPSKHAGRVRMGTLGVKNVCSRYLESCFFMTSDLGWKNWWAVKWQTISLFKFGQRIALAELGLALSHITRVRGWKYKCESVFKTHPNLIKFSRVVIESANAVPFGGLCN